MIKIESITKNQEKNKTKIICNLSIDENKKIVWFEVEKKYGKYLVDDRIDAYVVGLLNYAMRENHDIESKIPITDELLYNIETTLIPSLVKYSRHLHTIKINAPLVNALEPGIGVGTGCSCGVDSFDAIKNHIDTKYKNLDLTHLCINNVGAFNECYDDYGKENVKEERYEITKEVANKLGIELIITESNFASEIYQVHFLTNTYSGCFAIYMLQKLWNKYYLASVGLDYSTFTLKDKDMDDSAHYDLLTLQCFSNIGMRIYSEGGEKTRLEKTKNIAYFDIAQEYLHVCIAKPYNDNVCTKCMRTLLTLDAIDKLDNFRKVFDINYYRKHLNKYYRWIVRQHFIGGYMNEPTYRVLNRKNNFRNRMYFYKIYAFFVYGI